MEDNYLIVREYEARISDSISQEHEGFIEFKHSNGLFYFAWIKNNKVFLRSEGYTNEAARNQGVDTVIKHRYDPNNYRTESAHGAHFLILMANNNKEIARSFPMKEEIEAFVALQNIAIEDKDETKEIPAEKEISTDIEASKEKDTTSPIVSDTPATQVDIILPEKSEDEKKLLEETTDTPQIIRSPLLDSFQKEHLSSDSLEKDSTVEQEYSQNLEDFELDEELEEDIVNLQETSTNAEELNISEVSEANAAIDETELTNLTNQLYNSQDSASNLDAKQESSDTMQKRTPYYWGWLYWFVFFLVVSVLLWWLFQMQGYKVIQSKIQGFTLTHTEPIKTPDTAARVKLPTLDSASAQAKATWEKTLGGLVEIRLPDGSLIKVPENGTEKRLIEYLEAKCGTSELKKTWFDMDRILFVSGTNQLKEISDEQITLLAKIFKSYPNKKFKIGGYTDNIGNPEENIRLSANRAAAATQAIAAKGIDSTRMRYEGYGQEHPLCPANDTEECRAKNRRIAIRVDVCE